MGDSQTRIYLHPNSLCLFAIGQEIPTATRINSGSHHFILVSIPMLGLQKYFGKEMEHMHPHFKHLLIKGTAAELGVVRPMWTAEKTLASWLREPPVAATAHSLWYESKIGELLAMHLFKADSATQNRYAKRGKPSHTRFVQQAISILRQSLSEPLDLNVLARDCGCSGPYLSRSVKRETGKTLQQHLRAMRIETAARMLSEGANVTEAAFDVGYSSLSHFSKAFEAEMGLLPSAFIRSS